MTLSLPEGCNKRAIAVTFKPDRLKIVLKGVTVVDGELHKRIKVLFSSLLAHDSSWSFFCKVEDSTWYLEDGKLRLDMAKAKGDEWWKVFEEKQKTRKTLSSDQGVSQVVCVGDPEIDTTKLKPEDSQVFAENVFVLFRFFFFFC